jgi:CheY-like chemotaxis protein
VLEAIEDRRPDLALVDLQLANGSSGYSVAVRLHDRGIACLFTTGKPPGFPVPDLAIGCLHKPFEEDDLVRALTAAEDMLRGRQTLVLRPNLPERLQIYEAEEAVEGEPRSGWLPAVPTAKPSLRQRLSGWLAPH